MILGIEGSPRRKGNSHLWLQAFMDGIQEAGASSFQAHLLNYRYEVVAEFPVLRLFDRGIIARDTDLLAQAKTAGRKLAPT